MSLIISNESIHVNFDSLSFAKHLQLEESLGDRLKCGDYLAFNSVIDIVYGLIEESMTQISGSPYDTIVQLSRGKGGANFNNGHSYGKKNNSTSKSSSKGSSNSGDSGGDGSSNSGGFSGSGGGSGGGPGGDPEDSGSGDGNDSNDSSDDENKQNPKTKKKNKKKNKKDKAKKNCGKIDDSKDDSKDDSNDDKNRVNRLRDICICRGVSNCSGECGNTLIKGAIYYYMAIVESKLDIGLFNNKPETSNHEQQMWNDLIKLFDNNEKKEWLIDLMCLIDLMRKSLPGMESQQFDPFATDSWPKGVYRKNTIFDTISDLFHKIHDPNRVDRIKQWVCTMFAELEKQFITTKSSNNIEYTQSDRENYILNRLFHIICFHNYEMVKNHSDYNGM